MAVVDARIKKFALPFYSVTKVLSTLLYFTLLYFTLLLFTYSLSLFLILSFFLSPQLGCKVSKDAVDR